MVADEGDAFDRGNSIPGINQLEAFQNKVRAQINPTDPALAETFTQAAQKFLETVPNRRIDKPIDAAKLRSLVEGTPQPAGTDP